MSAAMSINPAEIARQVEKNYPNLMAELAAHPIPDVANPPPRPFPAAPHQEPYLTVESLPRYTPTAETTATIDDIIELHRQRQSNIRAKTKLILQAKALLRSALCSDADFEDDNTKVETTTAFGTQRRKLTKSAMKRVDDAYAAAKEDPATPAGLMIAPFIGGIDLFEARQAQIEKQMVKLAKTLPVYPWAKSVKGFGDISFATIVGECGDIGTYKSIAAVWKRLGLAVIHGNRQGAPGTGASAEDWVEHGYNKERRSVSWNARQHVIGGMGKWRPMFGEDVRDNPDLTEYQCVFAEQARKHMPNCPRKDGSTDIQMSTSGKESYSSWAANRAHRYVEKRLIKHLYLAWRRA